MACRTPLRVPPDLIGVGEIHDDETARAAIRAGLSGHSALWTMYSGAIAQVCALLLYGGIKPLSLVSAVSAVCPKGPGDL